ncbi:MAG: Cell envelope-related transcriptional attenuator [Candidatus Nomurabacteria bacterium GW2011_GWA1_46_11]|uniref:Cell envelope-related transcriptional attenuator n=1 Tax=Candidatus Nomurabacteria bacterium GW2011_GWA1_46_11 TaxID=1618732 RepID=A0A0G1NJG2_9BACT|nr:MAG: Cell envelope-related transcriptional attenuator [Candidatus Nomurabacteria bacterium GW2011_GWA1_46_11]
MALYQRLKRQILSKVVLVRVFLVLLLLSGFLALYFLAIKPLSRISFSSLPSHSNRINFAILGISGGQHEGRDLTDTLIFVSIDQSTGDTALLTIPRDLWIPSLRAKINTAYHYGEKRQPGAGGLILAKSALSEVLDQPVDFALLIDFSGFVQAIDAIGGIDITIDNAFIDSKFPIPGKENDPCDTCRYETVSFSSGLQRMDGATALKFVRSRNADGDEGTDFARSQRQTKVIRAFEKKFLFNLPQLKQIFNQSIITDIPSEAYFPLAKLGLKSIRRTPRAFAISEPLVYNPPISSAQDYQWVLLPQNSDFSTLSSYVKNLLTVPVKE